VKLIDDLLESVAKLDCEVSKVCVGLHWTLVKSRFVGIAHTYRSRRKVELTESGDLVGRSALELAGRLRSWELLEASLGLAALNSLIEPSGIEGNVFDEILQMATGKTVTVVGRFPSNERLGELAANVHFLELEPRRNELPAAAAEEVIPQSEMVVVTASALINKTLPRLLELGKGKTTIVLGPSTPMNDVLFEHGATILAGTRVQDENALFSSVMQGAKSFRRLAGIEPLRLSRGEGQ